MDRQYNAPAYISLYPVLREIAMEYGYTLAIHGTVDRDLDLIAIPWTDDASDPADMVKALIDRVELILTPIPKEGNPSSKPHGRTAWHLSFGWTGMYVDLSVTPRIEKARGEDDE